MTVCAVRIHADKIVLAADSIIITAGYLQEKKDGVKLWASPLRMLIATSGSVQEAAIMRMFTATHVPESATEHGILNFLTEFATWQKEKTNDWGVKNHYIFVYDGKVHTSHGLCVQEVKEFAAIGAGFDLALTALYLGKDAYEACDIACELSPYCERPVTTLVYDRENVT